MYRAFVHPSMRRIYFDPYTPDQRTQDLEDQLKAAKDAHAQLELSNAQNSLLFDQERNEWQQTEATLQAQFMQEAQARFVAEAQCSDNERRLQRETHTRRELQTRVAELEVEVELQARARHDADELYLHERSSHDETKRKERSARQLLQVTLARYQSHFPTQYANTMQQLVQTRSIPHPITAAVPQVTWPPAPLPQAGPSSYADVQPSGMRFLGSSGSIPSSAPPNQTMFVSMPETSTTFSTNPPSEPFVEEWDWTNHSGMDNTAH